MSSNKLCPTLLKEALVVFFLIVLAGDYIITYYISSSSRMSNKIDECGTMTFFHFQTQFHEHDF